MYILEILVSYQQGQHVQSSSNPRRPNIVQSSYVELTAAGYSNLLHDLLHDRLIVCVQLLWLLSFTALQMILNTCTNGPKNKPTYQVYLLS